IVNDGEVGKVSYATYVAPRLTGYESHSHVPRGQRVDAAAFPRYAEWDARRQSRSYSGQRYACTGPVAYVGQAQVQRDIDNLKAAIAKVGSGDVFMTAASPGVISHFQPNQFYGSFEEYL